MASLFEKMSSVAASGMMSLRSQTQQGRVAKYNYVQKKCWKGLSAGKHIQFGNTISDTWFIKNRRSWKPNWQRAGFYSEVLEKTVSISVTTAAVRKIDSFGGIDNYLLKEKPHKIGPPGCVGHHLSRYIRDVKRGKNTRASLAAKHAAKKDKQESLSS